MARSRFRSVVICTRMADLPLEMIPNSSPSWISVSGSRSIARCIKGVSGGRMCRSSMKMTKIRPGVVVPAGTVRPGRMIPSGTGGGGSNWLKTRPPWTSTSEASCCGTPSS